MSLHTKIVVFCGSNAPKDIARVEAALDVYADETNERACGFHRVPEDDIGFWNAGSGTTFIGTANYLDEDTFTTAVRTAAEVPGWGHYAPLTIILRNDMVHDRQCVYVLDHTGEWTRVPGA